MATKYRRHLSPSRRQSTQSRPGSALGVSGTETSGKLWGRGWADWASTGGRTEPVAEVVRGGRRYFRCASSGARAGVATSAAGLPRASRKASRWLPCLVGVLWLTPEPGMAREPASDPGRADERLAALLRSLLGQDGPRSPLEVVREVA
jgi:hypothetical protein